MNKNIISFFNKLRQWKNYFQIDYFDYSLHDSEISRIIEAQNKQNIKLLLDLINEKIQDKYLHFQHPTFTNITTFAISSIANPHSSWIFFMDEQEEHFWVLCQRYELIDIIVTEDKILIGNRKTSNEIVCEELHNLLKFNAEQLYFSKKSFAFYFSSRPFHSIMDQIFTISNLDSCHKDFFEPCFFYPYQNRKVDDDLIHFMPNSLCATWVDIDEMYYDRLRRFIIQKTLEMSKKTTNQHDLVIWINICTEKRSWINQIEGLIEILNNISKYFSSLKVYIDGLTRYENNIANIKQGFESDVIIYERLCKCLCSNKKIEMVSTIGFNLKEKVALSLSIDLAMGDNGTSPMVPYFICEKPYIVYNSDLNYFFSKFNLNIYKFVETKYFLKEKEKTSQCYSYHLPWQHVYNLAADILEQLSLDGKLKIKNLRMHRLDVPPVELLSRQYNLEQELKMKEEQIQSLNQKISTLELEIAKLTNTLNSLPVTKQNLEIKNLEQDVILKEVQIQEIKQGLINKQLQTKKLEKEIENEKNALEELRVKNQELEEKNIIIISKTKQLNQMQDLYNTLSKAMKKREAVIGSKLSFCLNYATAKSRIQNQ
ncbi:TPA: hypothetical protein R5Z05_001785, partial [Campylobacter coli]|nr:hypothetical protein [Campylobacter coli]